MARVLAVCLVLMLLSAKRRDFLVRRSRLACVALRDLRRALPIGDYVRMVDEALPLLAHACAALAAVEPAGSTVERHVREIIHGQTHTLAEVMRERLRLCADVLALLDTAPAVTPLSSDDFDLPLLRAAARADAWAHRALSPPRHLRLHLALLRYGLGISARAGTTAGQRSASERVAARHAEFARLARASVSAYAAVLRSSAGLRGRTLDAPHSVVT